MLYTLIGNGNPNRKEVIASLENLREGVYHRSEEEEFWLVLVDFNREDLSDACSDIVQWAVKKGVPFELYDGVGKDYSPEWATHADSSYTAANTMLESFKLTSDVRAAGQEDAAVLVISDDVYEDQLAMDVACLCAEMGIPVYDLGGQMTQLEVEEEEKQDGDHREPEPEQTSDPVELSREDLESLTLTELKAIVNDSGVVPRDMRSKDSLIDAILREDSPVVIEPEPIDEEAVEAFKESFESFELPDTPKQKYWLSFIGSDGELKSVPVNSEDADWLLNPEG